MVILYVLHKLYKFFSQRSNKSEHGFILGLNIIGKCEECVVVKLDNFKGYIQNYSITASAFIREIKITGHRRPKLTINWPTLKILNTANHSEPFVLNAYTIWQFTGLPPQKYLDERIFLLSYFYSFWHVLLHCNMWW